MFCISEGLEQQSRAIMALRFPLSFLVILIHIPLAESAFVPAELNKISTYVGFSHYISLLISFVWGNAAVPAFFLFSGYYMFFKNKKWSNLSIYTREMLKKFKSIGIPYLFWAIFPFFVTLFRSWIFSSFKDVSTDLSITEILYNAYWKNYYNFPLWYLKELIIYTLSLPLIYTAIKKLPYIIVPILILYLLNINTFITSRGLFFFFLGALLGARKFDILYHLNHYRYLIFSVALIGGFILPFCLDSTFYISILNLHTISCVMTFLLIGGNERFPRIKELCIALSSSSFFIYVVHEVQILFVLKGVFYKLGILDTLVGYLLCAILVLLVSLGGYYIMRQLMPKTLAVLMGNRG